MYWNRIDCDPKFQNVFQVSPHYCELDFLQSNGLTTEYDFGFNNLNSVSLNLISTSIFNVMKPQCVYLFYQDQNDSDVPYFMKGICQGFPDIEKQFVFNQTVSDIVLNLLSQNGLVIELLCDLDNYIKIKIFGVADRFQSNIYAEYEHLMQEIEQNQLQKCRYIDNFPVEVKPNAVWQTLFAKSIQNSKLDPKMRCTSALVIVHENPILIDTNYQMKFIGNQSFNWKLYNNNEDTIQFIISPNDQTEQLGIINLFANAAVGIQFKIKGDAIGTYQEMSQDVRKILATEVPNYEISIKDEIIQCNTIEIRFISIVFKKNPEPQLSFAYYVANNFIISQVYNFYRQFQFNRICRSHGMKTKWIAFEELYWNKNTSMIQFIEQCAQYFGSIASNSQNMINTLISVRSLRQHSFLFPRSIKMQFFNALANEQKCWEEFFLKLAQETGVQQQPHQMLYQQVFKSFYYVNIINNDYLYAFQNADQFTEFYSSSLQNLVHRGCGIDVSTKVMQMSQSLNLAKANILTLQSLKQLQSNHPQYIYVYNEMPTLKDESLESLIICNRSKKKLIINCDQYPNLKEIIIMSSSNQIDIIGKFPYYTSLIILYKVGKSFTSQYKNQYNCYITTENDNNVDDLVSKIMQSHISIFVKHKIIGQICQRHNIQKIFNQQQVYQLFGNIEIIKNFAPENLLDQFYFDTKSGEFELIDPQQQGIFYNCKMCLYVLMSERLKIKHKKMLIDIEVHGKQNAVYVKHKLYRLEKYIDEIIRLFEIVLLTK